MTVKTHATHHLLEHKYFVLCVLGFVNLFNYMDRNLVSVLLEQIKVDMAFSDTQLGLLGGFSFALCYAIFGVLLGRVADKGNRVWLLSISMAAWSLASAMCGLVRNFFELFIARMGVGIGEAGCVPSAHSLISDYFGPKERAFAVSVFTGIGQIGTLIGIVAGASLAESYGWRNVFLIFGIPGVLIALLLFVLIKEPKRGQFDTCANTEDSKKKQPVKQLLKKNTVKLLLIAIPLFYFVIAGSGVWLPSYYIRAYGISIGEFGHTGGVASGLGMLLGTFAGGWIVSYLIRIDRRWEFWLPALASLLSIPLYIGVLTASNINLSFTCLFAATFTLGTGMGSSMSALHIVADVHVRATAIGLMLLSTSLIAYGLSPLFIGYGSDVLLQNHWASSDGESLKLALMASLFASLLAALLFFIASHTAKKDLELE